MKAEVVTKSEKEHDVVLNGRVLGTSKARYDADFHANVINGALEAEYSRGYDAGYDAGHSDGYESGSEGIL